MEDELGNTYVCEVKNENDDSQDDSTYLVTDENGIIVSDSIDCQNSDILTAADHCVIEEDTRHLMVDGQETILHNASEHLIHVEDDVPIAESEMFIETTPGPSNNHHSVSNSNSYW